MNIETGTVDGACKAWDWRHGRGESPGPLVPLGRKVRW